MDPRFASNQVLPSKAQTEKLAQSFLHQIEPGLFERLENRWIRPHNETINVNGHPTTVTGMKYKCYLPEEDTYTWVIAGANQIITFEQGIKWKEGCMTVDCYQMKTRAEVSLRFSIHN
ncbi:hypothetical protein [Melghirimyces algeriensis]|uniref:Uncharacterized protein n=1 Tax=Melghirimyces algeriensis TaxID=910412 RepID=A0A521ACF1_9BACL|nr:hypothetical protein [Melghirimyces algeriensis]SMO32462.1 hypothetical protein SAMN06264849_10153 [Melghirimyces algeriensis]